MTDELTTLLQQALTECETQIKGATTLREYQSLKDVHVGIQQCIHRLHDSDTKDGQGMIESVIVKLEVWLNAQEQELASIENRSANQDGALSQTRAVLAKIVELQKKP